MQAFFACQQFVLSCIDLLVTLSTASSVTDFSDQHNSSQPVASSRNVARPGMHARQQITVRGVLAKGQSEQVAALLYRQCHEPLHGCLSPMRCYKAKKAEQVTLCNFSSCCKSGTLKKTRVTSVFIDIHAATASCF